MKRGTLIVAIALVAGLGLVVLGALSFLGDDSKSYQVPSEAMEPTFSPGDRIVAEQDAYQDADPMIGDVITFNPPIGADGTGRSCGVEHSPTSACPEPTDGASDQIFIKRIVALEGDTWAIEDGIVIVNGEPLDEADYTLPCEGSSACDLPEPITIPEGHVFLMGDNRGASDDSRFWGPAPVESIDGLVAEPD